jgi:ribosome biogenesis GTPase / thiamine phosphate phosphatase
MGRKLEIVCGDRVECKFEGDELIVAATLPRNTFLRRSTLRGRSEPLAANLTQLAVVIAPMPVADLFMVDRYLSAAECAGLHALIVLNKSDLAEAAQLRQSLQPFASLGYEMVTVSAEFNGTAALLAPHVVDRTTIFVGQSGVGKSSLTRLLTKDEDIAVGELVRDEEGRHTTTASRLYDCEGGGRIMDSPGVRDFAPAIDDLERTTLGFRELGRLAPGCRFQDCLHLHEPGCAVQAAAASGDMHPRRYESYRRMRRLYQELWAQRPERERAARPR